MYNPEEESKVCAALRFPLMCGIVVIHAQFSPIDISAGYNGICQSLNYDPKVYYETSRLISQIICAVCVPLFYFISGYLFFFTSRFNLSLYKNKIKRRFHSLFIPYVFWNLCILLFYLCAQYLIPSFVSSRSLPISEYTLTDLLWSLWDVSKVNHSGPSFPIAAQFWFIRNLMVVVLCSPILYWGIKYLRWIFLICLGGCWFFHLWPNIPGLGSEAFFFFSLGAWFSLWQKNFTRLFSKHIKINLVIYSIACILGLVFWDTHCHNYLQKLVILLGIPLYIGMMANSEKTIKFFQTHNSFSRCSFFMYSYHFLPLVLLYRYILKMVPDHSDIICLSIYFICPLVIIVGGYYLYLYLDKYLPRFTSIITGGR